MGPVRLVAQAVRQLDVVAPAVPRAAAAVRRPVALAEGPRLVLVVAVAVVALGAAAAVAVAVALVARQVVARVAVAVLASARRPVTVVRRRLGPTAVRSVGQDALPVVARIVRLVP